MTTSATPSPVTQPRHMTFDRLADDVVLGSFTDQREGDAAVLIVMVDPDFDQARLAETPVPAGTVFPRGHTWMAIGDAGLIIEMAKFALATPDREVRCAALNDMTGGEKGKRVSYISSHGNYAQLVVQLPDIGMELLAHRGVAFTIQSEEDFARATQMVHQAFTFDTGGLLVADCDATLAP